MPDQSNNTTTIEVSPDLARTIEEVRQLLGAESSAEAVDVVLRQFTNLRRVGNEIARIQAEMEDLLAEKRLALSTPSKATLEKLALRFPPPPEWYEGDEGSPF